MAPLVTMRTIYLVRHAIAAEHGDEWPDDAKRPLTNEGAAKFRRVAGGLAALGVGIDLVLTSPLTRAKATADLVARSLNPRPEVVECAALAPGHSPSKVADALAAYAKPKALALVGHEPDLGELAAWLLGTRLPIPFKKGGICRIDVAEWPPARQGTLRWFAPPRMLRRVK